MNSDQNSDSEQCTKSKLNRVYSAHTLAQPAHTLWEHCAQAASTARIGHRVVAHRDCIVASPRPCRESCRACAQQCRGRVVRHRRRLAGRLLHAVSHARPLYVAAPTRPCRRASRPCRSLFVLTQKTVSRYNSYLTRYALCRVHPTLYRARTGPYCGP